MTQPVLKSPVQLAENLKMDENSKRLLADIRELAPAIRARAAEIEAGRRIPLDLVEALRSIGVFRMFVPRSHGGLELDLPRGIEIIEALSRIDGSVGWTTMIGSGASIMVPLLPRATFEQVYQNGPDVIIASSTMPAGTAEAEASGWRVNGRWPFVSGCQHADWIHGLCVVTDGGTPFPGPHGHAGPPLTRAVALPARHWQIDDTWYVAGLKGTGSHHVALNDMVVPAENFFDLTNGVPCVPGPLYRAALQLIPLMHVAVAVGIAEGAADELVELANTGRQQVRASAPMRDSEIFHGELGRVAAEIRAARAVLGTQVESHWRRALAGTLKDAAFLTQSTQTAIWVATTCVRAADACFALGGGSALYETSPLQRRLRDLHALGQHALTQQRHYVAGGKLLLDRSVADAELEPRF
jgi:alkylation response protein AidB-like acyl-CoA dehydrogenase